MLKFLIFEQGRPAKKWSLRNAHLLGADGNAVRGEIVFRRGTIECQTREPGAVSLAMLKLVGECGELTVRTCLLPERDEPYLLNIELVRHHLMLLFTKQEDWQMFDLDTDHKVTRRANLARRLFIEALCRMKDDPAGADAQAEDALIAAIDGGEELTLSHSDLLLKRRRSNGSLPKLPIGCGVRLEQTSERLRAGIGANFDFLYMPISWRQLAPEEGEYRWAAMDSWIEWVGKARLPALAGPLVSIEPNMLPDWIYIWEHDYDTLRDLIYEHVERVVSRYGSVINTWIVASGLHVNDHLTLTLDQVMDLTRMTTMLVKKTLPSARVLVELRQPFGEYYAGNPRAVPPLTYAELIVQGAMNVDGFAVKLLMGQAQPGQFVRDLIQISALLDQFVLVSKPVTLVVAAPSEPVTTAPTGKDPSEHEETTENGDSVSGHWRKPWSQQVQSHWLEAVFQIALCRPFVEAVIWNDLVDHAQIELRHGGLISEDFQPKAAFRRLAAFRKHLSEGGAAHANHAKPAATGA